MPGGKFWIVEVDGIEYYVKASTSSTAVKKGMLAWKKKRSDERDLLHKEDWLNVRVKRTYYRTVMLWEREKSENEIL